VEPSRNIVLNELQLKAFWLGLEDAPMEPGTRIAQLIGGITWGIARRYSRRPAWTHASADLSTPNMAE
jgi:hypothetical protein